MLQPMWEPTDPVRGWGEGICIEKVSEVEGALGERQAQRGECGANVHLFRDLRTSKLPAVCRTSDAGAFGKHYEFEI